ncbi:hypothetical protein Rumeso_02675 [Rubellimicrobium mesophilum DSM 19309]|uniref:CENP-V/GFA domain-containing protein n=1 Tax=Rubellimicrobium mesophilum DSM 19309 TaxID=442562 RepID=A0A017HMX7_9RHOB|nr:hypothetical protein Rumeso_02675 [Rubellimicrobium mesophilum DSM 19309]
MGYEVEDDFKYAMNCHCSRCRKAMGSAFKPMGGIEVEKVRLTRGQDRLLVVGEPDGTHDLRCRDCGSLLYSIVREGTWAHVTYGTLTDAPSLPIQMHIMVGSKAPWLTITDDLPQHREF